MDSTLQTIHFYEIQLQLVPLIPHSSIAKTVLLRFLNFNILTRVETQPFKQRLNQKRHIILTNVRHIFSFAQVQEHFLFYKIHNFLFNYNTHPFLRYNRTKRTLRGIHFMKCYISKIFELKGGNRRNKLFSCRLCIIYQLRSDRFYKIQFNITFLYNKKSSYSLANEKMFCKFVKIMRRFCFNRCFKG